jgi:hypothetical protein
MVLLALHARKVGDVNRGSGEERDAGFSLLMLCTETLLRSCKHIDLRESTTASDIFKNKEYVLRSLYVSFMYQILHKQIGADQLIRGYNGVRDT